MGNKKQHEIRLNLSSRLSFFLAVPQLTDSNLGGVYAWKKHSDIRKSQKRPFNEALHWFGPGQKFDCGTTLLQGQEIYGWREESKAVGRVWLIKTCLLLFGGEKSIIWKKCLNESRPKQLSYHKQFFNDHKIVFKKGISY